LQATVELVQQRLDDICNDAAVKLRAVIEDRLRTSESHTKGLAIEVSEAREQVDCLGFKRYGGAW
jgi:hypothetical protein